MKLLRFLKPSPYKREIQNTEIVKKKYNYWRIRTFYSMYIGYAFYYFTRKSFTFAVPVMVRDLGFDKAQIGILASILSLTYGASKFVSGIISDKSNPQYFMAVGLMLTGIFNIFFGLSSSLIFFAIFWGLNGWFQGFGWPPCAKLLTHWYSQSERGTWWSIWNTSHNLGGLLIPIIASFLAAHYGWRMAMYVPGVSCIVVGFFLINRLRDTPRSLGLPPIEKYKKEKGFVEEKKVNLSAREILFKYVLNNKYIWLLAIASFFIYVIRTAINDWTMLFLVEEKGYSTFAAGSTVCMFEFGGFFGSLVAGWSSDFIFKGKRGPVNTIFSFFILITLIIFWKVSYPWALIDSVILFFIGFFVFGPQMLIGVAAAELSHKKGAGTATGFVSGIFAYIGAAAAGGPLGIFMQKSGWEGFFVSMSICCVLSIVLLSFTWFVTNNEREA